MMKTRYRMTNVILLVSMILAAGGLGTIGCGGGDVETNGDSDCSAHTDCQDDEACLGETCVDAPVEDDPCPDEYEGKEYEALQCQDGMWHGESEERGLADIGLHTEPPTEVVAGESLHATFELLDEQDNRVEVEGVEISIETTAGESNQDGGASLWETDASGLAEIDLVFQTAGTGNVLTATSEHPELEGVSVDTDPIDVIAADVDADESSIGGEDGVADGETAAEITIELHDEFRNPVPGITPEFTASGDGNAYETCTETDDEGVATCGMTSTSIGDKTLEIVEPVSVVGETIEFVVGCNFGGEPCGGGDGTPDDPFRICAPEQLATIGTDDGYFEDSFVVFDDIDMDGVDNFHTIGHPEDEVPFSGEFDGNHHTIENLTIEKSGDDVAMFGYTTDDSVIRDVHLHNISVSGAGDVASLAVRSYGEILRCRATDIDISATSTAAGGLVSRLGTGGVIEKSYTSGVVTSENNAVGGIAAQLFAASVYDSYSTAEVVGDSWVGGLVGNIPGGGQEIYNSYSTGLVDGSGDDVGGFIGRSPDDPIVDNSYWDVETSDRTESSEGSPLDTDDFAEANAEHFEQWDFDDVWEIGEAPDGETRPILQWQTD